MERPTGGSSRTGSRSRAAGVLRALPLLVMVLAGAAHADPFLPFGYRTVDGAGNNLAHPFWGRAGSPLLRSMPAMYADSVSMPPGPLPGAREISNVVAEQAISIPNANGASGFLWQWGQFVDHDIDLTPTMNDPSEAYDIPVPMGDPFFDPDSTGNAVIPLQRSMYSTSPGPRQQMNMITAFLDGSNIYGSDANRAAALRTLDGTGRLRTSAGDLLPFNTLGLPNAPTAEDPTLFLSGDVRANEQVGLTALHTLFVREHNFWADSLSRAEPGMSGDEIYLAARSLVGAEMQAITYNEFLPKLLGPRALPPYAGYDPDRNPGIRNEFSTGAYRLGHSLVSPVLLRMDASLDPIPEGHLPLRDAFFHPGEITDHGGIEPVLRGLAHQPSQEMDPFVVDDIRNFMFGPPGAGGFDLAALNIQRGRDHGLPRYNQAREAMGLAPRGSFDEVSSDPAVQARLAAAYENVDDVDFWVGALAEDHVNGGMVGELVFTVLEQQFEALRDGDRFWYEILYPPPVVAHLQEQTLAAVIRRNTAISSEIPDDVFTYPGDLLAGGEPLSPIHLGYPAPNPMRGASTILLTVDPGPSRFLAVQVFDVQGRRVKEMLEKTMGPGTHPLHWDGTDSRGSRVSPGTYLLCAASEGHIATRKVVVLP